MDQLTRNQLVDELKENDIWLKKSYGQHFLVEPEYLNTIIESAQVSSGQTIVEVGPGLGSLTRELSLKNPTGLVLAIEADWKLVDVLRNQIGQKKNVKIVHENALTFDWATIEGRYQIIANLPYNVASPLLHTWLIKTPNPPERVTVMIQREVAERLIASAGTRTRGLPTVMVELAGQAKIVTEIPPTAFFPPPKVNSAIIDIKLNKKQGDELAILKIAKAGFSNKRRTLENSLSGSLRLPKETVRDILKEANIDSKYRAEDLSVVQWRELTSIISEKYRSEN